MGQVSGWQKLEEKDEWRHMLLTAIQRVILSSNNARNYEKRVFLSAFKATVQFYADFDLRERT
jgi:hypothetical protein